MKSDGLPTLDEIALRGNSDRSSGFHGYCEYYHGQFSHMRNQPVRLLEIGILGGDGLVMWSSFFQHPMSTFLGVDLVDRNFQSNDPRIMTVYGDSGNKEFLDSIQGPFDIIAEDASHFCSHQINAFGCLWKRVSPGGVFIIEDAHTVHSPQHCDMHINIIQYFARIAEQMQDARGADGCAKPDPSDQWHSIASLEFRKGLIIVRKR